MPLYKSKAACLKPCDHDVGTDVYVVLHFHGIIRMNYNNLKHDIHLDHILGRQEMMAILLSSCYMESCIKIKRGRQPEENISG
jgi:hypothetical protein